MEDLRIGLVGAGRIGSSQPGSSRSGSRASGWRWSPTRGARQPRRSRTGSAPHCDLIIAAARGGTAVFCEKPASMTLAEANRSLAAVAAAGRLLQVGFNRRLAPDFRAAHDAIVARAVGSVLLLRSLTRDPGLAGPGVMPPWTNSVEPVTGDVL